MRDGAGPSVGTILIDFVTDALNRSVQDRAGPLIVGLSGAQGSGKSTVAQQAAAALAASGMHALVVSLDDLYLPSSERRALAAAVHPLLATRGVPGTHDVDLGGAVLAAAATREPFRLPRFSKASDDRLPDQQWPVVRGPFDLVLFEGWCVGAAPESEGSLSAAVNGLEQDEDPNGVWRRYVNGQLEGAYRSLFARLDRIVFLAAPDFSVVARWRKQQEHELASRAEGASGAAVMDDAAIDRFILHYERITRHMLRTMPGRAHLTIMLDENRAAVASLPDRR